MTNSESSLPDIFKPFYLFFYLPLLLYYSLYVCVIWLFLQIDKLPEDDGVDYDNEFWQMELTKKGTLNTNNK